MEQGENQIVQSWLNKASDSLKASRDNINIDNLTTAQNRLYYSLFYSVMGLAYSKGFSTSKHSELLGWFLRMVFSPENSVNYIKMLLMREINQTIQLNFSL